MALSQQAKDIISELPLKDTLNQIRDRLGNVDIANPRQEDVASLLSALVGSPTAFSLLSPDGNDNVAAKLFPIQQQVRGASVEPGHFCDLVRHVVLQSSDIDIWEAVFDIIENLGALTPPLSSIAPTF
ncbi:serine/threonine-protein kinase Sgk2 [Nemania serpens]|nr:serine/threonine-protein kinase Sgk2 [Nemania serpens]